MASPPFILAFDLGAPKLAAAVYDFHGERLCTLQRLPAMANQPQVLTLMNIKRIGAQAIKWASCAPPPRVIVAASPASFDASSGRLSESSRLPRLGGFDLASFCSHELGAPLELVGDAGCLALGEAREGAVRGLKKRAIGVRLLGKRVVWGAAENGRVVEGTAGEKEIGPAPEADDRESWRRLGARVAETIEGCEGEHCVVSGVAPDQWDAFHAALGRPAVAAELGPEGAVLGAAVHACKHLRGGS